MIARRALRQPTKPGIQTQTRRSRCEADIERIRA